MVVVFLQDFDSVGTTINDILPLRPTSLESFDDHTLKFAFRFFFSFRKTLGWKRFILLGLSFIPVLRHLLRFLPNFPKIILLCEFEGEQQSDIDIKIHQLQGLMDQRNIETQLAQNKHEEEKFWIMRRESFNLLRKNVKHKHTAPFIDDLIVPPETLPEFLPQLTAILERYKFTYTVAGHMGDGNFHIIPLMDLKDPAERQKIYPALQEITELVLRYHGSLSGEHNDGLIRGPMLRYMYSPEMVEVFQQVKHLFDPDNIFNPHKKTDANLEFSQEHMRESF
jgi:FAD/FMN-containing dehydrogenase